MDSPVTKSHEVAEAAAEEKRLRSAIQFPAYNLTDSIAVAKAIHDKGGGYATREHLAAFLEYKSTNNGAFLSRLSSAKLFGLVAENTSQLRLTPLADRILMPESPDECRSALVEAFLTVPLFKAVYDEYKGKDLPQALGLHNALRNRFQIVPGRIEVATEALINSAETAGFFETRGSKTQLIIPVITKSPPKPTELKDPKEEPLKSSGGGGELPPVNPVRTKDELQNEYIGTLIEVLREKSKEGQMDNDLMERIERLLNLKSA